MVSAPKAPQPEPAEKVAAAQTQSNRETAITQKGLNADTIVTPQGREEWTQSGTWADGTPRWQKTTTLSDGEQQVYDTDLANRIGVGNVANQQIGRIGDLLGQPVNLDNEATEARLNELGRKRLDPRFQQEEQALAQSLANRGIRMGSKAWQTAMDQFGQGKNDAYNQLLLQGRGQAVQEALTARNQPINEITALMSGSQVSQPNFVGGPTTGMAPTDVVGAYRDNFNGQMAAYNANNASRSSMLGGIGSIAGTLLGGWGMWSDRRLKADVEKMFDDPRGWGAYSFRYVWDEPGTIRFGYMADEVMQYRPDVVADIGGYLAMNYGALEG